ncbi:hypothetical protein [Paenibacillus sp. FSL H3-0333]|uniref:hypothetical protein n=1 Tax=Paenibacillus sp. FSL H3-0333 TaxID=2921373 RepID=UPI0030F6DC9A
MNESYIIIYNEFLNNGDYKLSNRELYVYCLLYTYRSHFYNETTTTIGIIAEDKLMNEDTNQARNNTLVKKTLLSLVDKKVIILNYNNKISANSKLTVKFPHLQGGYEQFNLSLWNMVNHIDELIVLIYLKRYKGFEKSKDHWSSLIGYSSKNTGVHLISKMELDNKIYHVEGDKYIDSQGRVKQHPTKWYIGQKLEPEVMPDTETDPFNSDSVVEGESDNIPLDIDEDKGVIRWGHWKSGNLDDSDYDLYVSQRDNEEFLAVADKKISMISKNRTNDKVVYAVNKGIKEAEERLSKRKYEDLKNERFDREQSEIKILSDSNHTLIRRDEQILPFDPNDIRDNDMLLRIGDKDGRYSGTYEECIVEKRLNNLVRYYDNDGHLFMSEKSLARTKDYVIGLLSNHKYSEAMEIIISEYRNNLFLQCNAGKREDEVWEGDYIQTCTGDEENIDLTKRRLEMKRKLREVQT